MDRYSQYRFLFNLCQRLARIESFTGYNTSLANANR